MAQSTDLTAILLRGAAPEVASLRTMFQSMGLRDFWLRCQRLEALELTQIEVFDALGRPAAAPNLLIELSRSGQLAAFVHVNHEAKQAVLHAFSAALQVKGWMGEPAALDDQLKRMLGHTLGEILAADDGTRHGIGAAASETKAVVRERMLQTPIGAPLSLESFTFHDAGHDIDESDRVALVALDEKALHVAWKATPGVELSARIGTLSDAVMGPLKSARPHAMAVLRELGDSSPAASGLTSAAALELVASAEILLFAVGETLAYVDRRFLPMFSLASAAPNFADEDDEELEEEPSIIAVMTEVLPYSSPGGTLLEQIGDDEVRPLVSGVQAGEEVAGSLFALDGARLRKLLAVDQQELALRVDQFYHSWWNASYEGPDGGEAFSAWRRRLDEEGADDLTRFLRVWAEWRLVLEMCALNHLTPALLFYGG